MSGVSRSRVDAHGDGDIARKRVEQSRRLIIGERDAPVAETPTIRLAEETDSVIGTENGCAEPADSVRSVQFTVSQGTSSGPDSTGTDPATSQVTSLVRGTQTPPKLIGGSRTVRWFHCRRAVPPTPTSDFRQW